MKGGIKEDLNWTDRMKAVWQISRSCKCENDLPLNSLAKSLAAWQPRNLIRPIHRLGSESLNIRTLSIDSTTGEIKARKSCEVMYEGMANTATTVPSRSLNFFISSGGRFGHGSVEF